MALNVALKLPAQSYPYSIGSEGRALHALTFVPFPGPFSRRLVLRRQRDDPFFPKSSVLYMPSYVGLSENDIANERAFIPSYSTGLPAASTRHEGGINEQHANIQSRQNSVPKLRTKLHF